MKSENSISVHRLSGGYAMDTISSTAFGVQVDSQENPDHPMMENAKKMMGNLRKAGFCNRVKRGFRVMLFCKY